MGVLPDLLRAGYSVREMCIVDERGHRSGGFDAALFREAAFGGYTTIARGDLGAVLVRAIDTRVETLFGDSITGLEDGAEGVLVHFEHAPSRRFDMVVGADGLHSLRQYPSAVRFIQIRTAVAIGSTSRSSGVPSSRWRHWRPSPVSGINRMRRTPMPEPRVQRAESNPSGLRATSAALTR